jgi:hypothetical protein
VQCLPLCASTLNPRPCSQAFCDFFLRLIDHITTSSFLLSLSGGTRVAKVVAPKRAALAEAEAQLATVSCSPTYTRQCVRRAFVRMSAHTRRSLVPAAAGKKCSNNGCCDRGACHSDSGLQTNQSLHQINRPLTL